MLKRFRTILFWCHLTVGVAAGLVVLIMCTTGVLLAFQRQITVWADLRGLDGARPAPGAARLPISTLVAGIPRGEPARPTAITVRAAADAPVQVAFGRERVVFVNAYTGRVLGEGSGGVRRFFRVVTDWHRWLGRPEQSRAWGKALTGAANLGFLFLVVSGFYLWWPRNWTRSTFRNALWFRGGLSGKARDFSWHHVIGIWSLVPLFVIVLSGVVISYRWAGDLVYRAAGETPPAAQEGPGRAEGGARGRGRGEAPSLSPLDPLVAVAERQTAAWRTITLQVPKPGADSVRLTVDAGTGGQPQKRGQLTLSPGSGAVLAWEPFAATSPGRRARSVLRFAHTGEVLGLAGQALAGLVSLGAAVMVWTGLALSWRRLVAWRRRRDDVPEPESMRRRRRRAASAGEAR